MIQELATVLTIISGIASLVQIFGGVRTFLKSNNKLILSNGKKASIAFFLILFLGSAFVALSNLTIIPIVLSESWQITATTIVVVLLLIGLLFKIRSSMVLDIQKALICQMSELLNVNFSYNSPSLSKANRTEAIERYLRNLRDLCEIGLKLALTTGLQKSIDLTGTSAVLFLVDTKKKNFIPVIVGGGKPAYVRAVESFRPPLFDMEQFAIQYNLYRKTVRSKEGGKKRLPELVQEFRKKTQAYVSTTGIVFETESKIFFDRLYDNCLTFRFEFLSEVPDYEQDEYRFQKVVGIPIYMASKKIGVLLLLSRSRARLYKGDRVYWIIGLLVGAATAAGFAMGYFQEKWPNLDPEQMPNRQKDSSWRRRIVQFINSLSKDFSRSCEIPETSNTNVEQP